MFPFDFGFIPSTVGGDGDPLDIMLLLDEPTHVGCMVDVRLVGVLEAEQTEHGRTERNDRRLGIAVHSYRHANAASVDELGQELLNQIEKFFSYYNEQRGKKFRPLARGGPRQAAELLKRGIIAFQA